MESIDQTIAAVCTATPTEGVASQSIIRISGVKSFEIIGSLCRPATKLHNRGVFPCSIEVQGSTIDAMIYAFFAPHSYTGQDVAELHLQAPPVVIEAVFAKILQHCRMARPGEFTLRAYLSGRMDLTQAEAVAQVISAGNHLQLEAARRMLDGRLSATLNTCREDLLILLGRIEAGLDFSTEDISLISVDQAIDQIIGIRNRIQSMLDESIHGEELMDLPSVGLAGLPNAGKSSLMNALLGRPRSLVSPTAETTRDVLEAEWVLPHGRCVLFDCAGLLKDSRPDDILASMAQRAAEDALTSASILLFCADGSKPDWSEDLERYRRIVRPRMLVVLTQQDRWMESIPQTMDRARQDFGRPCLVTSTVTSYGIDQLRNRVDAMVMEHSRDSGGSNRLALTRRHRQSIHNVLAALQQARQEMFDGHDEIVAMLLRSAIQQIDRAESEPIDEQVLSRIFSRFCIGK